MKRLIRFSLVFVLLLSLDVFSISSANAAKVGGVCKKLNLKDWAGNTPVVCKKNKLGKLVWTKFSTTTVKVSPTPVIPTTYKLNILLIEYGETLGSKSAEAVPYCNSGGYRYKDISASTGVEVRDGSGSLLATGVLGTAVVVDSPTGGLSSCVFKSSLDLKKTDFYQIKIGTRYNTSFSFADMEAKKWAIGLNIGD
jgi:hypothetical protein